MKYILLIFILIILVIILLNNKEHFEYTIPSEIFLKQNMKPGEGTYKKKPFNFNSRKIVDAIDEGVLGNFRVENNSNSFSQDINFNQMNTLLEYLIIFNEHSVEFKNIEQEDYKNICLKIISLLNRSFKNFNLNHEYHKNDERKYELVKFEKLVDEDTKFEGDRRLVINIEFYKKLMNNSFIIQFELIYSPLQNYINIRDAIIIGQKLNEKIHFNNLNWNQTYCNLEDYEKYMKNPSLYKTKLQQCHKEQLISEDEMKLYFKNLSEGKDIELSKAEKDFFKNKQLEEKEDKEYKKFKCFGKEGFNESTCRSFSEIKQTVGTWDKPCNTNDECPFYQKNKNYKNTRGGCIKGFCEMPLNIRRLGYKEYDKNIKPFCYNCNIKDCLGDDCYTCCDQQKNRKKYPQLNSPDYAFKNDNRT